MARDVVVIESKNDDEISDNDSSRTTDHYHHHQIVDEPYYREKVIVQVDLHRSGAKAAEEGEEEEEEEEEEETKDDGVMTMVNRRSSTSSQSNNSATTTPIRHQKLPSPKSFHLPHHKSPAISHMSSPKQNRKDRTTTSGTMTTTRTTTTTSTTTTSTGSNSSNGSSSGSFNNINGNSAAHSSSPSFLPKVSLQHVSRTTSITTMMRMIPPTPRRLVVSEKHIGHLRAQERENIVQWYHQQQQQPPPPPVVADCKRACDMNDPVRDAANSDIDLVSLVGTKTSTTSSLVRDSSHTSSITSHDVSSPTSSSSSIIPTFLIVTGPTGSGKTKLLQSALQDLMVPTQDENCQGYYIRGVFDILQHPDPYRAYIMALNDFATQVMARGDETNGIVATMRQVIVDACGEEIHVLTQMIPSLSTIVYDTKHGSNVDSSNDAVMVPAAVNGSIVNDSTSGPSSNDTRPSVQQVDATQRFIFVFQKFLRAICSVVPSIIFLLDDIQYADDCSIDVLCSILADLHQMPGLLVAATYNGTDLKNDKDDVTINLSEHPATTFTESVAKTSYFVEQIRKMERCRHADGSIHIQTVAIENFDEEQVQYLLTQTLQQCSLFDLQVDENFCALVMEHTSGNIYHIIEFLHWLEDQQLLTTNGPPNGSNIYTYWTWNMHDIYHAVNKHVSQTTGDPNPSVPQLFYSSNKIDKVPFDVVEILKVGACIGNSRVDETMIEYVLGYPVRNYIAKAVDMGILLCLHDGKSGKQYAFVHENVHMLAYHLIPASDRELFHLEIGRRLWRRCDSDELDQYIFVVLSQIRMGRQLISRLSERYRIAALCLHAGRKAAKSSSFRISLIHLKFGIELLGDRAWRDEYDLTLMLYNATAEMEVSNANYEGMELLVAEILQHSRCADDTIPARTTEVYALCVSDRQHEGLNRGIQLMSDLGFAFPVHFSLWTLRSELKAVLSMLKGKSNDYLKRLPAIEDAAVLAALHVLNMLYLHAVLVRPRLAAFVSLKMMKLTLTYGLSFISPLAFATFGMLCAKIFPTPDAAFRYGELGLELLDKFQVREYLPRIYAAYYACIFPWKHHLPEALDHLIHAERVGMQTGDVEFACLCANLWGYTATDSDIPLDEVETHWLTFQNTMKSRRQKSSLQMSLSCLQAVQYLQGKDVDLSETEQLLKYSIENKIVLKTANIRWWEAKTALLFNDMHHADEIAYVANFAKNKHTIPPTSEIVQTAFLNGMIALVMASQPRSRDGTVRPRRTRKQYIAEGKRMIRLIKKYVLWAPINYYDKQVLLEAELAAVEGRKDQAMQQYTCAIALSKISRNIMVQGLSNERAGRYCFSVLNQPKVAMKYFDAALLVYGEWKAYRKVDHLQTEIKMMLGSA